MLRKWLFTPRGRYALAVRLAFELLFGALVRLFVWTVFLVGTVGTVGQIIAAIALVQTLFAVRTSELFLCALHLRTVAFVRTVEAVRIAVAQPGSRYADAGVRTGVLEVGARFLGLAGAELALIRTVTAVVLTVALPGRRNATTIFAGEFACGTGHIGTAHLIARVAAI